MIWTKHLFVSLLAAAMGMVVLAVVAVGVLQFLLARGPLELPMLQSFVEDKINEQLAQETFSIGAISLTSGTGGAANRVVLRDVTVFGADHKRLLNVPEIRTDFSLMNLFRGTISPSMIEIVGTRLDLVRELDGRISILQFSGAAPDAFKGDILGALDKVLLRDELVNLRSFALRGTDVTVKDLRSGHVWEIAGSLLQFTREGRALSLRTEVSLLTTDGVATSLIAKANHEIGDNTAGVSLQFSNADPRDLADLVGALDWLRVLETRISGSLTATLQNDGAVDALSGVLDLGQGRLRQTPSSVAIGFERAKVYFAYDKATDRLEFAQITVDTTAGAISAEGYAGLERTDANGVGAMAGQFRFKGIVVNPPGVFAAPLELDGAALDFRVSFNPLSIDVGALSVFDGPETYRISGRSVAGTDFWTNSYDIEVTKAAHDRVIAFWPVKAVPKTRKWLADNFTAGHVSNFRGGLRSEGGKFKYAFNFDVADAEVKFMRTMPPVRDGQGFGTLTNKEVRVDLVSGYLIAPDNTRVDLAGSGFHIPDITARPAIGDVRLDVRAGLQAALHLLDVEKFEFLSKVGLSPDVAQGMVAVKGTLQVPLIDNAKPQDVKFSATAEVTGLTSDTLIKGHALRADKMQLSATDLGLEMHGPVTLDGVPMQARWRLGFGKLAAKGSEVIADVGLSQDNLDRLGITLPKGSITGETPAQVVVNIKKNQVPTYQVTSTLVGARLSVPALQWVKSTKSAGELTLNGSFGKTPTVDNLSLNAKGLTASGKIEFNADGSMKTLRLSNLRAGQWLDSSAVITMGKGGASHITLQGGAADMRNFNISGGSGGGSSGVTGGSPIDIRLDRLTVISGLALTDFIAKLEPGKGMTGSFTGRVNGGARITGTLFPHQFGTAFDIKGVDAGRVLASADLMENVFGGSLWVVILPRAQPGEYDGSLKIKNTRVTSTSAMAGLLNGISVVGLVQQLEGEGVHFSKVEGKFLMRPNGVQIKDLSAVGPSVGITVDGWYNSVAKTVDFEGVATPLYALNGLIKRALGKLGGRKKGEGLFSFTYKMRGSTDDPKVSVNPLSILTPGAFREIFRTKAPLAPGEAPAVEAKPKTTKKRTKRRRKAVKQPFSAPESQDLR